MNPVSQEDRRIEKLERFGEQEEIFGKYQGSQEHRRRPGQSSPPMKKSKVISMGKSTSSDVGLLRFLYRIFYPVSII